MTQLGWTLLISIVLVFLSCALFMGIRASIVVTTAIPLTALIVLFSLSALGIALQQMSVMGIVMAFGLLVDDAIVLTEHIHRRCSEGRSVRAAAIDAPAELFAPLLTTTLTTVAAFVPIYLLPGGTGEFVRSIPIAVTLCLLAALLVAATVIPALYVGLHRRGHTHASVREDAAVSTESRVGRLLKWYKLVLLHVMAKPLVPLSAIVVVLVCLAALGTILRRDFFSPVQRDEFVVDVFAPQGSSLKQTADFVQHIESLLAREPEVDVTSSSIGRNAPLVFYNLTSQETYANHFAQLIVRVDDWRNTSRVAERVQAILDEQIIGADCCAHVLEHGAPFTAPFEVRISGPSIQTLREAARRAADILTQSGGVRNVRDNYGQEALRLVVQVNESVAKHIGIDQQLVANELRYRFDGLQAGYIQEDDEQVDVNVRLPETRRAGIADLNSVYFKPFPRADRIPFSTLANIEPKWETASIYRRDGQRTVSVLGYPRFGLTSAQVSRNFSPRLQTLAGTLTADYSLQLGGENESGCARVS